MENEAAKTSLLARADAMKDKEVERVRGLLSRANTREAELLTELQTVKSVCGGKISTAQSARQDAVQVLPFVVMRGGGVIRGGGGRS